VQEAATLLARVWTGEAVPERRVRAPLFHDFAATYRERRRSRWKPSSLETYDGYLRHRLLPAFRRMRLDTIDHARVSAWFDAASAERPGAANRAFEILRAMLATARQWGELGGDVPDACANIVMNPRRPVARFLSRDELQRLGAVLDRHAVAHPWPVAAIRLLTLTGARLSEVVMVFSVSPVAVCRPVMSAVFSLAPESPRNTARSTPSVRAARKSRVRADSKPGIRVASSTLNTARTTFRVGFSSVPPTVQAASVRPHDRHRQPSRANTRCLVASQCGRCKVV